MTNLDRGTAMPSRPFDFRLAIGASLAAMFILLLAEPTNIDFFLAHLFYTPELGFVGRRSYWLENILHDGAKQVVIAFSVLAGLGFVASLLVARLAAWRRRLGYLLLAMSLSTAVVPPLKTMTAMHCPWSLTEFGGSETYTPLVSQRAATESPGRCWPGGHAATGFSLLALYFALRDIRPRTARCALGLALVLGGVFSLGRMMQGAHFLSHNLWTLLIDWTICCLCYRALLYRPPAAEPDPRRLSMATE